MVRSALSIFNWFSVFLCQIDHFGHGLDCGGDDFRERLVLSRGCLEVHGHPEGFQALGALQILQLHVLDLVLKVAGSLQIIDIFQVFGAFLPLGIDNGNLARVGQPLRGIFDAGLVNALLNDLVADVIRPLDLEAPFIRAEADGQGRILGQDEVRSLQGHRQTGS